MSITIDEQIKHVERTIEAAGWYFRPMPHETVSEGRQLDIDRVMSILDSLRRVEALEKENAALRAKISKMEEKAESEAIERAYRLPD